MIQLHAWPTPNAFKVSIFLEETGTPYEVVAVDIGGGDQFAPAFLEISPNGRMPAIVDTDGPGGQPISVFESGAILCYLGEKTGRFFPQETRAKYTVLQWLFWQMAGVGPMFGQAGHFTRYAPEKIPYAIERYTNEVKRLCTVLDGRLAQSEFVAGEYSIADMAIFPWMTLYRMREQMAGLPHLQRWLDTLNARPAVQRGLELLKDRRRAGPLTDAQREALFGTRQIERK
jgi:GST-like protein